MLYTKSFNRHDLQSLSQGLITNHQGRDSRKGSSHPFRRTCYSYKKEKPWGDYVYTEVWQGDPLSFDTDIDLNMQWERGATNFHRPDSSISICSPVLGLVTSCFHLLPLNSFENGIVDLWRSVGQLLLRLVKHAKLHYSGSVLCPGRRSNESTKVVSGISTSLHRIKGWRMGLTTT